jgi:tRNA modification GTPase
MRRHVDAAKDMLAACESAQLALNAGHAELAAADLNEAMKYLGRIGDRIVTDDVLDLIFGRFCLGK